MSPHQEAADQLISYLVVRFKLREVVDPLVSLNRTHKAGAVANRQAVKTITIHGFRSNIFKINISQVHLRMSVPIFKLSRTQTIEFKKCKLQPYHNFNRIPNLLCGRT